jgi:hypothetical protein
MIKSDQDSYSGNSGESVREVVRDREWLMGRQFEKIAVPKYKPVP